MWTAAGAPQCTSKMCGYSDKTFCNADSNCQWANNACQRNVCPTFTAQDCPTPDCQVRTTDNTCQRAMCTANNQKACLTDPNCNWGSITVPANNGSTATYDVCSIATPEQRQAAADDAAAHCVEIKKNYGGLIAGLVILLLLLGASLAWIVYRQKQKEAALNTGRFGFSSELAEPLTETNRDSTTARRGMNFDDAVPANPLHTYDAAEPAIDQL